MKKTALVTGASRGIGRAAALALAKEGWRVVLNYFSSEGSAVAAVREILDAGGEAIAVHADVSDPGQVGILFAEAEKRFGPVELLVNNAGISHQKLLTDLSDEDWRRMMGVHLDGCFYCCRAALPAMIRKKAGKIINLSSIWGMVGGSCEVHYSAAKAGIIGLTKALAKEVGPSGIQVNCVAPGVIATEMNGQLSPEDLAALREETPLGRIGAPEDVAAAILFLASPAGDFITGQVLSPNGGFVI